MYGMMGRILNPQEHIHNDIRYSSWMTGHCPYGDAVGVKQLGNGINKLWVRRLRKATARRRARSAAAHSLRID
jgi:hypothetical protein